MPMSKAHNRASAKWNANRDNIMIRPEIPEGTRIREEAAKAGMSIQNYVLNAVRRYMELERGDPKPEQDAQNGGTP